jgi:hypothetical protein
MHALRSVQYGLEGEQHRVHAGRTLIRSSEPFEVVQRLLR